MAAATESGVGTLTNPFRCVVCKVSVPNHKQKGKCAHCFVAQQVCESLIRKKQKRMWKRIRWQKNEKAVKKVKGETMEVAPLPPPCAGLPPLQAAVLTHGREAMPSVRRRAAGRRARRP